MFNKNIPNKEKLKKFANSNNLKENCDLKLKIKNSNDNFNFQEDLKENNNDMLYSEKSEKINFNSKNNYNTDTKDKSCIAVHCIAGLGRYKLYLIKKLKDLLC